jgi:hypothetical protein
MRKPAGPADQEDGIEQSSGAARRRITIATRRARSVKVRLLQLRDAAIHGSFLERRATDPRYEGARGKPDHPRFRNHPQQLHSSINSADMPSNRHVPTLGKLCRVVQISPDVQRAMPINRECRL